MRIQFNINHQKSIEIILWVLKRNSTIDIYQLMKVLFHADLLCLNKYGCPITGDNYLAMKFGTVPESIYNGLIKQDILFLIDFEENSAVPLRIDGHKIIPLRNCKEDDISEADIECLEAGIKEYSYLSFSEIRKKNHAHPAWRKTYDKTPNSLIDWYDLIEEQYLKDDLSGGWSELMVI